MTERVALTSKQLQSQATRRRLVEAAFEEFQLFGFAGARVDRIAERAKSNKRLIYIYFGDKAQLFDAVVARDVEAMIDAVPFAVGDLPGYAVGLFDYLEDHPEVLRLFTWRNLERTHTSEIEQASYRDKVVEIEQAQRAGRLDPTLAAVEVLSFLLAVVSSWMISSEALRTAPGQDLPRDRRRESVREAISRFTQVVSPV